MIELNIINGKGNYFLSATDKKEKEKNSDVYVDNKTFIRLIKDEELRIKLLNVFGKLPVTVAPLGYEENNIYNEKEIQGLPLVSVTRELNFTAKLD